MPANEYSGAVMLSMACVVRRKFVSSCSATINCHAIVSVCYNFRHFCARLYKSRRYFTSLVTGSATLKRIRTRHWSTFVHYPRLPHFRCGTRRALPDIDDGTQSLVSKNIFAIVDGESAACNSRTDRRFCSVNRVRRGNSLRSFFNYSTHDKKCCCIVALGSNVER